MKIRTRWIDPEVSRVAGEIAKNSFELDAAKAEKVFRARALAPCSLRRVVPRTLLAVGARSGSGATRRSRSKHVKLLAPVYGCFTEGFDTLDLKEAKALLDELHA
jgi:hypothetical protein